MNILLDDITTTGTIMSGCERLFEENGAQREHIGKIVLAKSMNAVELPFKNFIQILVG